ncbi:MAG: hypothetical protein IKU00_08785 [Bacteroidales bacterium]|nr:hypothetical protein [Bacteroidales bacterium]
MNDFEKTKCLSQYSSLSESEKAKAEFYILDKYPFTLYVVPEEIHDIYEVQQEWYNSLASKPSKSSDINAEHIKWALDHLSDAYKLYDFNEKYEAVANEYERLKDKYFEAIEHLADARQIDLDCPTYLDLVYLTDEKRLVEDDYQLKMDYYIHRNPLRNRYVERFVKTLPQELQTIDYVLEHLTDLDLFAYKQQAEEFRKKFEELKREYPGEIATFEGKHGQFFPRDF